MNRPRRFTTVLRRVVGAGLLLGFLCFFRILGTGFGGHPRLFPGSVRDAKTIHFDKKYFKAIDETRRDRLLLFPRERNNVTYSSPERRTIRDLYFTQNPSRVNVTAVISGQHRVSK